MLPKPPLRIETVPLEFRRLFGVRACVESARVAHFRSATSSEEEYMPSSSAGINRGKYISSVVPVVVWLRGRAIPTGAKQISSLLLRRHVSVAADVDDCVLWMLWRSGHVQNNDFHTKLRSLFRIAWSIAAVQFKRCA